MKKKTMKLKAHGRFIMMMVCVPFNIMMIIMHFGPNGSKLLTFSHSASKCGQIRDFVLFFLRSNDHHFQDFLFLARALSSSIYTHTVILKALGTKNRNKMKINEAIGNGFVFENISQREEICRKKKSN